MERQLIVTGAGSGIGLASALHLSEMGFSVTGVVRDDAERAALEQRAQAKRTSVATLVCDLADAHTRKGLLSDRDAFGLVNNAGYMNAGQLRDVALDDARRQFEVMVFAPVDLTLQVLPAMLRRGDGRVVNITSSAAHAATPLSGWYQGAKAALRELTDALRIELQDSGVDVIELEPGGTRTGIWDRAQDELRERRRHSHRPASYARALEHLPGLKEHAIDPERVAVALGEVLTAGRPPRHRRVGPDATALRIVSDVVPDRIADRLVHRGLIGPSR